LYHHNGNEVGVLGSVDANGDVVIYVIISEDETFKLKQVSKFSLEDRLALSLDWNLKVQGQIVVSDSKGELTVLSLTPELNVECVSSWKGHDFEAWIAAFDAWSPGDSPLASSFRFDRLTREHSIHLKFLIQFILFSGQNGMSSSQFSPLPALKSNCSLIYLRI